LAMLDREQQARPAGDCISQPLIPRPLVGEPAEFVQAWESKGAEIVSAVGHADTAALFSVLLGRAVPQNRVSVKVASDVILLVGQYVGPRLPEGATTLPEGAVVEWWVV